MTAPLTLADMVDDAALVSLEHQLHLTDVIGESSWHVDLAAGRLEFAGARPLVCERIHLLGSAAPGLGSWLWSWANPAGFPAELIELATALRGFGEQHGIAQLTSGEVPFAAMPEDWRTPLGAVSILTDAAKAFSGRFTAYNGDAGGGTRAAFIVEHREFTLPAPDPTRVLRVLQQGVAELPLVDHRRAVHGYAQRRPLPADWADDGTAVLLSGPGMMISVRFDEQGRVGNLHLETS